MRLHSPGRARESGCRSSPPRSAPRTMKLHRERERVADRKLDRANVALNRCRRGHFVHVVTPLIERILKIGVGRAQAHARQRDCLRSAASGTPRLMRGSTVLVRIASIMRPPLSSSVQRLTISFTTSSSYSKRNLVVLAARAS